MGNAVNIAFWCILPYSYQYAPLLLPCAIGNGIAAGGAYAALDVMGGGPASKLLKNPLIAGGGIGAFVGLVAPSLLYGPVCSTLYGIEHMGLFLNQAFTEFPYIMQISVTTGFAAGIAMYPMLHYPIYGVPNVPWQALTGAVLCLVDGKNFVGKKRLIITSEKELYLPLVCLLPICSRFNQYAN